MKKVLILSAFLTGFAAIALEVLWTRVMVMVVGGSVYAFTVVLVSFLVGIALGSLVVAFSSRMLTNAKRIQTNERMLAILFFAGLQLLIGVLVIFTIPALGDLPFGFLELFKNGTSSFFSLQFLQMFMVVKIIILPTLLMGISLPLLIKLATESLRLPHPNPLPKGEGTPFSPSPSRERAGVRGDVVGSSVGKVYGANTFGGVLGSLVAGFVLIPMIGVQNGILGMGIVYLITGVLVLLRFYSSSEGVPSGTPESRSNVIPAKAGIWIPDQVGNDRVSSRQDGYRTVTRQARTIISIVVLLVAVGTVLVGLKMAPWDQQLLSSGFYKDPFVYAGADKTQILKTLKNAEILYEEEGISAHVSITKGKDGVISLKINGKADASTGSDMENQLLLGHLPMLLHPSSDGAKEVLVVGMGSGITLGSILSHPVEHVDAIEIEEKVVEAARYFNKYSNNALDDPRVNIIVGDGRNFLLAKTYLKTSSPHPSPQPSPTRGEGEGISSSPRGEGVDISSPLRGEDKGEGEGGARGYDVITSEPSNPWLSGSSKLFTKEYFGLLRKGIKEDGVVLQWINLYAIDIEGLKRVLAAFDQAFPHVAAFGMPASNDLALIGANKPIAFDYPVLVESLTGPHPSPPPSPPRGEGESVSSSRGEGVGISSPDEAREGVYKDTLSLEGRGKGEGEGKVRGDLAKVGIREPFEILAYFVMGEKEIKRFVGDSPANTDNHPYVEFSAPKYLYTPVATNPWRVIYENLTPIQAILADGPLISADKKTLIDAENFRKSRLLTQVYSIEHNVGEGIKEGEKALKIDPDNIFIKEKLAKFYFEEGTSFFNQSQYAKAISSLSKSLNLKKTSEAYFNLGQTYGWDGNLEKARENYEKAVALDPEFEQAWVWLADTASQLGDLNDAISYYQQVVRINPKNVEAYVSLGNLYILRKDFGRAEEYLNKALKLDPDNEEASKLMKSIP